MPEMAYRVYDEFDPQNIRRLPDGSFAVSAVLPVDEWMYSYIMSFGEFIEVLGPEHVRESVRKKLECANARDLMKKFFPGLKRWKK
jgi:predicted DNA-binding transcriptional regulator YafY